MKAIRLSFRQMLSYLQRDMMLFAVCFTPLITGICFKVGIPLLEKALADFMSMPTIISPYYKLIDIIFSMITPVMFCFASAMIVLEEKDENIIQYLSVTPLGKTGYLVARFGISSFISFLITISLLPFFKITKLSFSEMFFLSISGTLQGIIIALMIVSISSNKLEGMAVTKISSLTVFAAVIPFFVKHEIQYLLFPFPTFWIGKAMCENIPFYMLLAFALSALWIYILLQQFFKKM